MFLSAARWLSHLHPGGTASLELLPQHGGNLLVEITESMAEDVDFFRGMSHVSHIRWRSLTQKNGVKKKPAHCGYVSIIISNKWKMETDWMHQRVVHWVSWYRYYRFSNSNLAETKTSTDGIINKRGEVWRVEKQWLSQSTTIEASDGWCFCANVQKTKSTVPTHIVLLYAASTVLIGASTLKTHCHMSPEKLSFFWIVAQILFTSFQWRRDVSWSLGIVFSTVAWEPFR